MHCGIFVSGKKCPRYILWVLSLKLSGNPNKTNHTTLAIQIAFANDMSLCDEVGQFRLYSEKMENILERVNREKQNKSQLCYWMGGVARTREWRSPKSLGSDEKFKP